MDDATVKLAVLGSCISRDSFNSRFNPTYKQMWECVLIQNQSSLISLMSEPLRLEDSDYGEMSAYDKWNVRTDTSKEFLERIVELAPAYLVLDFFGDVHFGVLELPDGRFITNNRWKLWPTNYYKRLKQNGELRPLRIETEPERYLELWKDAYDRLVAYLAAKLPDTTVIVHRGHNTTSLRLPDVDEPVSLPQNRKVKKIDAETLNKYWTILDDYAIGTTGYTAIDLTDREYSTFDDHPWGPFYVHYTLDYYANFLAELNVIHLSRELTGPHRERDLRMLDQVVTRDREHLDAELRRRDERIKELSGRVVRQKARIRKQKARIKALEESPMRKVVRRVRRRFRR